MDPYYEDNTHIEDCLYYGDDIYVEVIHIEKDTHIEVVPKSKDPYEKLSNKQAILYKKLQEARRIVRKNQEVHQVRCNRCGRLSCKDTRSSLCLEKHGKKRKSKAELE
ncbi:unnamed protein product [Cunninghamella echinulata]